MDQRKASCLVFNGGLGGSDLKAKQPQLEVKSTRAKNFCDRLRLRQSSFGRQHDSAPGCRGPDYSIA